MSDAQTAQKEANDVAQLCLDVLDVKRRYKNDPEQVQRFMDILAKLSVTSLDPGQNDELLMKYLLPLKSEVIKIKKEMLQTLLERRDVMMLEKLVGKDIAVILLSEE